MVEIAWAQSGCLGARMTGAGFGGCAVALVSEEEGERFAKNVAQEYERQTGLIPKVYICHATNGASEVNP
jgi:galactokinase